MNLEKKTTLTQASVIALIITAVFIAGITVAADLVPPLKSWLATTHGHHWVGKGIWTIIVFVLFTIGFYVKGRMGSQLSPRLVKIAGHSALLASLVITFFFVYEYMSH